MFKKIVMLISTLIGISFGLTLGPQLLVGVEFIPQWVSNRYVNAAIYGVLFWILGGLLVPIIRKMIKLLMEWINTLSTFNLVLGIIGMLIGLILGYLLSLPFSNLNIPFISSTLPLIFSIVLALVGYQTMMSRREDIKKIFDRMPSSTMMSENNEAQLLERKVHDTIYKYKLLDTSVIIDGRIKDVVETDFIEGILLIPNFVLQELQHIADSSDSIKRIRGRRGLDILNELQKNEKISIEFYEGDFEDITEVDSKLIRLAKMLDAAIITNDFNLNKVCEFQNIKVLNINVLANALKSVVLPGETLKINITTTGTERHQGVGYLDDGTMIVVEDGEHYLNKEVTVVVTRALQTAAGRMIFAKPMHSHHQIETNKE